VPLVTYKESYSTPIFMNFSCKNECPNVTSNYAEKKQAINYLIATDCDEETGSDRNQQ
jgi:hypothetical protein